jgi:hypothetical protein
LGVVLPGVVIYGVQFDIWNVFEPTFLQARKPTGDLFLEPGIEWVTWRHYLLVGPLAVLVSLAAWRTEKNPVARVVLRRLTVFSGLGVALFSVLQWSNTSPLLAIYFYSAIPLALCTLSLAVSVAAVFSRSSGAVSVVTSVAVAIATVTAFKNGVQVNTEFRLLLIAAVLAICILAWGALLRPVMHVFGTGVVLCVASWAAVSSPHDFPSSPGGYRSDPFYDGALFASNDITLERAQIVHDLSKLLPSLPAERGELLVWFESGGPLDQLAAPFAWYRSALQSPSDPRAPEVTETVRWSLLERRPRFVLIMDVQEPEMLRSVEAVRSIAPYAVAKQRPLRSGTTVVHLTLLERKAGTWRDFPCDDPANLAPVVCP